MKSFAAAAVLGIVVIAGASSAAAADYPARKPGLWEIAVQSEGDPSKGTASKGAGHNVTQQCIDAASDKAMRDMGNSMGSQACSRQDMRKEGGKLVIDSVCKMGSTTATTRAVMSGDFSSSYRMETRSTYSPPMMGRTEGAAVIEARWIGPCKAGQKPGDMIMSNGMKMNMLEMMKTRK